MLVKYEYRPEIRFKKVRKVQNINNIPMNVGLRRTYVQNGLYMVFKVGYQVS
jgi:hypothetical protein